MIANQGQFHSVSLLKKDAKVLEDKKPQQIISPKVAAQVTEMLKAVVQPGGTAYKSRLSPTLLRVKPVLPTRWIPPVMLRINMWRFFAGMAPADNPEIVSVVVINEPTKGVITEVMWRRRYLPKWPMAHCAC